MADSWQIYFDPRWVGNHGIGRFSDMLDQRLKLQHLKLQGKPSSPLEPWRLMRAIRRLPAGAALFTPGYNAPLLVSRPFIFTIHDLNHLDRAENSTFLKRLYYRLVMRRAARRAFRILTISEFSRQRIIAWSGIAPERVVNVGNGVAASYSPRVAAYAPGYPYLLCVSNRKAHKNEPRLIEAYARAGIATDIHLLFTGTITTELLGLCRAHGVVDRVGFLGPVPEAEMPSLYRGAKALLFPSLYEGFGLPVIEAMACGIPVLAANTTALPEVSGDAALLVDPLSVTQIIRGIEQLCGDETLRAILCQKGLKRAAKFRWEEVAARVASVLGELQSVGEKHD